ncbi:MAG: ABC transporter permease [Candidatus Eisenbacteria bacterium]|nr:ABC transporter permease [Candidatus Eisenbacteria bacterium]
MTAQAIFLDSPQPAVDQLPLICGSPLDPADTTGVLVDRGFAIPHHLAPGDSVDLAIGRARYRTHIRGIVLSSEHLAASVDPQSFIPQKGSLLVVFGNLDLVAGRLGFRMVNDLAVRYAPGSDRRQAEQEVLAACGRAVAIEEAIPRERRFGYRFLEIDVRALSIYAPAIAWTLGGLSLLIAILSFRRMVLAQRREIGTLRALGSSRRQILSWYAGTAALLGLAGIAAAFAPAIAIRDAFARIYGTAIGLPRIDRHFYAGDFLLASIPALLASVAAISAPVLGLLRRSAAATIRAVDSAPARLAPSLLRLLDWTAPMRLTSRWAARNLIRRPGLTAVTTLALAGALGVAVAYRFSSRSMTETAREACRHERWDLSVHFLHPAYPEEMAPLLALPGIRATEPFVSRVVEIEAVAGRGRAEAGGKDKNGGKDKDEEEDETNAGSEPVTVLGIDPCARLRTVTLREGRMPSLIHI